MYPLPSRCPQRATVENQTVKGSSVTKMYNSYTNCLGKMPLVGLPPSAENLFPLINQNSAIPRKSRQWYAFPFF
jgi:hypothetical protein